MRTKDPELHLAPQKLGTGTLFLSWGTVFMALWLTVLKNKQTKNQTTIKIEYSSCKSLTPEKHRSPWATRRERGQVSISRGCERSGWVLCKLICHTHLSPLSLLDGAGALQLSSSQILLRGWGRSRYTPLEFLTAQPLCAPAVTPPLCWELPFLLVSCSSKAGWTALLPSACPQSGPCSYSWHTPVQCAFPWPFSHTLDVVEAWPRTSGEAHSPLLPAAAFQAHSDGKPFRQKARKGQTHNANHISPGCLLLLYCPFSFGL